MSDATCGGQPTAGRPYFARILPRLSRRVRVGCRVSDPSNFENHQRFQFDIGDTAVHNQLNGDDVMICNRDAALMRISTFVCGATSSKSAYTFSSKAAIRSEQIACTARPSSSTRSPSQRNSSSVIR